MYATTSLFHFLGLMKYVGEYIEDKSERRHVDATDLAIAFMQENINRTLPHYLRAYGRKPNT